MMTSKQAQEFIDDLGDQFFRKHGKHIPRIKIKMKTVYETWGGMCYYEYIHINRGIVGHIHECFSKEIMAHEFAHHVVDVVYKGNSFPFHSKQWKSIAKSFGAFPLSTHFYPTAPFILDNMDKFYCYECNGNFKFVGENEKNERGEKFRSGSNVWMKTDNKQEAINVHKKYEEEYTAKEITRRLGMVNIENTFWKDYAIVE